MLAPRRKRLSTTARVALYESCIASEDEFPRCNIPGCGLFVRPGERWVESHYPKPHAWNGTQSGIAHARCNHDYWSKTEAPMMARANRVRAKHIGAFVADTPLPGGRDDRLKKTMRGVVVERATGLPVGARR